MGHGKSIYNVLLQQRILIYLSTKYLQSTQNLKFLQLTATDFAFTSRLFPSFSLIFTLLASRLPIILHLSMHHSTLFRQSSGLKIETPTHQLPSHISYSPTLCSFHHYHAKYRQDTSNILSATTHSFFLYYYQNTPSALSYLQNYS